MPISLLHLTHVFLVQDENDSSPPSHSGLTGMERVVPDVSECLSWRQETGRSLHRGSVDRKLKKSQGSDLSQEL